MNLEMAATRKPNPTSIVKKESSLNFELPKSLNADFKKKLKESAVISIEKMLQKILLFNTSLNVKSEYGALFTVF